ncbi:salicylate hydroxylase [Crassisporium funariophilum]|nr:salicylate hydroxylase [Crassisporium funariophilum]
MTSATKDFKVAIVGGGMCGLACAVNLTKAGLDVTVFEAAPKFDEIGAGVGFGPNAIRALQKLGLLDAVLSKSDQATPTQRVFSFVSGTGNHEEVYDYAKSSPETVGLGLYRPAFLEALMPLLDPRVTHFNKRCVSVAQAPSGRQLLHFADSTSFEADLVIGADGIKSVTRNEVVGEKGGRLGFSNTFAYRGMVPIKDLVSAGMKTDVGSRPCCWIGLDKHIITFPIKGDTVLNIVAFVTKKDSTDLSPERPAPWVEVVPHQELLDAYQGWGADVMIILRHMAQPSRWSIHTLYPPLETYVHRNIVLVGDSAHGMLPHLGAGVGQGFEDVYTLCRLLTHPRTNKSTLPAVLQIYNSIRPPRANMVLERSIRMGNLYESFGPGKYNTEEMRHHLAGMWEPVWNHDLEAEVSRALEKIEQKYMSKM